MNNENLFEIEEKFQPFLLNNDYTFIGPVDTLYLTEFYKYVNKIAPKIAISRLIHHSLSNKSAIKKAISILPQNIELKIYVVISNGKRDLIHTSIEDYCRRNNLNFLKK